MRFALTADNTGTPATNGNFTNGKYRTGLLVQHSNLIDSDYMLSMQYITSTDHVKKVTIQLNGTQLLPADWMRGVVRGKRSAMR